jgi:CHAT domain-containing protein
MNLRAVGLTMVCAAALSAQEDLASFRQKIDAARSELYKTGNREVSTAGLTPHIQSLDGAARQSTLAGRHAHAAECLVTLGDALQIQNRISEALHALGSAIEAAERAEAIETLAEALYLDGMVRFLRQNDRVTAAKRVERVLEATQTRPTIKWRAYALSLRAEIEEDSNRLDDARNTIKQALSLGVTEPRFLFFAWYDRYSSAFGRIKQIATRELTMEEKLCAVDALRSLREAARIAKEQGWEALGAPLRPIEGNLQPYLRLVIESSEARKALDVAGVQSPRAPNDVYVSDRFAEPLGRSFTEEETARIMAELAQRPENRSTVVAAASVAAANDDHDRALALYEKAVTLLENDYRRIPDDPGRTALQAISTGYYYSPMALYLDRKQHARAFTLMEKGRAAVLNDAIMTRARIELADPGQADLYRRLQETREALVAVAPSSAESVARTKEYEGLLAKARQHYPELLTLVTAPSADLAAVQRETLAGGFDLLEYVCLDGQLVVFHVGPSGTHAKSVFVLRKSLVEKAAALSRSLSDRRVAFDETTSRELYLFLVQPVREFLTTRHLVVIPHDALYSIPFSVLKEWPDGRFLADSFKISYSPSATVLLQRPPVGTLASASALVLTGPGVKEAALEARAIAASFPDCRVLPVEQSTPTALRNLAPGQDVIHIVAHGSFDPKEPTRSAILLSRAGGDDGVVTAAKMYGLPLRGAKLVTLGACESGVVEGTETGELLGIPRALLYAGARAVLLSRWPVDSAATFEFMRSFYSHTRQVDAPEAARRAAGDLRKNPRYAHPYYWAAFDLIGR